MPYILQNPEIRISVIAQKGFPRSSSVKANRNR